MKLDLTKYDCDELELVGQIKVPSELKRELLEIAEKHHQLEDGDGIFFHQDYSRSGNKHHFHISLEQLTQLEPESTVEIYYAVVEPGEITKSTYQPEYLLSRIVEGDVVDFRCNCAFNIKRDRVNSSLSAIPLSLAIADGEIDVVYKGVDFTLRERGREIYDLLLQLVSDEKEEQVYRFEFTFTYGGQLSAQLPGKVLNQARSYLSRFARA